MSTYSVVVAKLEKRMNVLKKLEQIKYLQKYAKLVLTKEIERNYYLNLIKIILLYIRARNVGKNLK